MLMQLFDDIYLCLREEMHADWLLQKKDHIITSKIIFDANMGHNCVENVKFDAIMRL